MPESIGKYQSYVVRLWHDSHHVLWRASAQNIQTYEISHFADLDSLFAFLMTQTTHSRVADHLSEQARDVQYGQ